MGLIHLHQQSTEQTLGLRRSCIMCKGKGHHVQGNALEKQAEMLPTLILLVVG